MVYREHGRTNALRLPTAAILAVIVVAFSVLNDACRSEGSLPLNNWINGDTVQLGSRRGITTFARVNDATGQGKNVNGIIFYLNAKGDTILKTPFRDGKENGEVISWYDNGKVKEVRSYINGKKTGTHRGWYYNGTLKFEYNYSEDEFEGAYREWYPDGQLFRDQHFSKGHEEGMQSMYFPDGKIRSNYLIKNKRRYGLPGTQNCSNASDSIPRDPSSVQ